MTREIVIFLILSSALAAAPDHLAARETARNKNSFHRQGYIETIHAKSLRGYVRLTNVGTPVEGFIVEQWSRGWKHRLGKRVTDANGFFAFNPVKPGKYYLRYHLEGFATDKAIVIVSNRFTSDAVLITESTGEPATNESMHRSAQTSLVVTTFD